MNAPSPAQPGEPTDPQHRRILTQMGAAVGVAEQDVFSEDAFVGFFQSFRPDGLGLSDVFDGLPMADDLQARLTRLFDVAGDDRRPRGGRDAYFVVRRPQRVDPDQIQAAGDDWLRRLTRLAVECDDVDLSDRLRGVRRVRLLEGAAPKSPKEDCDKTGLFRAFDSDIPTLAGRSANSPIAESLRTPYYFITCDPHLRDYLMWPLYASHHRTEDPFEPYFDLWRHGVKFRIYREDQIDLYMPRWDE
ncbi:MAG: apolipoprotein acyltransferase [Planctomycetota bacterium]